MSTKYVSYVIGAVILIAVVIGAATLIRSTQSAVTSVFQPNADAWYSVFLKNDQVYFGKIGKMDGQYMQLTKVYYLSNAQKPQPLEGEQNKDKAAPPKFTLIKLGRELHDPIDEMLIRHDAVAFIEQLQDDSRIIQAIQKAKNESVQK